MIMNSSYGSDGLNEEKFTHTKIVEKEKAIVCQRRKDWSGTREISNDIYDSNGKLISKSAFLISTKPHTYKCKTCLHCNFFTLDNSKFWLLNFVYNLVYKSVDRDKVMIIYCDTDCVTMAISGDKNKGMDQGFDAVIKDKDYWDEHKYSLLPDHSKGKAHEKKLLGFATENIGDEMIALAPKNYSLHRRIKDKDGKFKMDFKKGLKGVDKKRNEQIDHKAFQKCAFESKVILGENCGFHPKKIDGDYFEVKDMPNKIALSGVHTKMVVMENGVCAPYINGLTAKDYIVVKQ
jgi:hypothetical protein